MTVFGARNECSIGQCAFGGAEVVDDQITPGCTNGSLNSGKTFRQVGFNQINRAFEALEIGLVVVLFGDNRDGIVGAADNGDALVVHDRQVFGGQKFMLVEFLAFAAAEEQTEERPRGNSIFMVIVKILLSLCFALIAAIGVTHLATIALKGVHRFGPLSHTDLLNIVFVLVFVIIALGMVTRVLVNVKKLGGIIPLGGGAKPKPKYVRNPKLTPEKKRRTKEEEKKLEALEEAAEEAREAEAEKQKTEEEKKKAEEDAKRAEEEAQKKAEEEAEQRAEADALTEIITMKAFTDDAFEVLDNSKEKQDAHTVFGLVLFLVGEVQSLSTQRKLP